MENLTQGDYSRLYIVQALFRLMKEYAYEHITITDITAKAGVGRATFYRYFKSKEDVLSYYFTSKTREFEFAQRYLPRCKQDYVQIVKQVMQFFSSQKEQFILLKKARLEYFYLDFLNQKFCEMFEREHPNVSRYSPYLYAGMLFNISIAWLENGFEESADELANLFIDSINI